MSMDRTRREYAVKTRSSQAWSAFLSLPHWWLRWELRTLQSSIDRIERELSAEFALSETSPMIEELAALTSRRDTILKKLADRG